MSTKVKITRFVSVRRLRQLGVAKARLQFMLPVFSQFVGRSEHT